MNYNCRERGRRERATAEANRAIARYSLECGEPVSWYLTPEQLDAVRAGKLDVRYIHRNDYTTQNQEVYMKVNELIASLRADAEWARHNAKNYTEDECAPCSTCSSCPPCPPSLPDDLTLAAEVFELMMEKLGCSVGKG